MTDARSGFDAAVERLTPIVIAVLQEQCPWVFAPQTSYDDRPPMFDPDKLYSTRDLAKALGVSEKTLHNRMYVARKSSGTVFDGLVSRRLGRQRVYEGRDLNDWWASIREVIGEERYEQEDNESGS